MATRIGTAIRAERKACGMTLEVLAEQAGISVSFASDVERGNKIPGPETVLSIANVFPDIDSTAWLWLLLADSWEPDVAETMRAWAVASGAPPAQARTVFVKMDSRGGTA